MAKRYYQSVSDRMSESRGMERYETKKEMKDKRMMGEEYYASFEDSKRRQLEDSGMISEDRRQVANMPQEVIMKSYDRPDYARYSLDDTARGVDDQMDSDVRGARKYRSSRKY